MGIRFRELERGDLAAVTRWRNDPELIRHLGANFLFIGPEVDQRWYDAYLAGRDRAVRLAMVDEETGQPVGCVSLTDIHRVNRSAEFSIMIGEPACRGRGYGTLAGRAILAHAFDDLNLHRVYLMVLADHATAIRLYDRLGFRPEGVQRQAVYKLGRYHDVVMMGLLADDYRRPPSDTGEGDGG